MTKKTPPCQNKPKPPPHQPISPTHQLPKYIPLSINQHPISTTKDIPSPPRNVEAFKETIGKVDVNFNILNHSLPNHLGVHKKVVPNKMLTFASCHCLCLETQSFRLIQMVQRVIQIMMFLVNFLGILSPTRACFPWNESHTSVRTPHNSYMIKVLHLPNSPDFTAIPKLMLNIFTCVWHT